MESFMRLSFITQFKNEFLLPFTSCYKVLGKMPDMFNATKVEKKKKKKKK